MINLNLPDRIQIPTAGQPIQLKLKEPEHIRLQNGSSVYLIREGVDEVSRVDLVLDAGTAQQEKMLVASGVCQLLKEGTHSHSSREIADKLDYYGAYFECSTNKDNTVLTLYTLSKHIKELFPLFCSLFFEAAFPEEELKIYIDRQRQEFLVNSERVRYRAMLEFNSLVFGEGSRYGQTAALSDYDQLKREDILSFYRKYYRPENAYLIVSGCVDEQFIPLAEKYFGQHTNYLNHGSDNGAPYVLAPDVKEKFVLKAESMQSAIRIGLPIMNKQHPDYNRFVLLNTVLGGYFGSRLMTNLREDKGLTYGVSSFLTSFKHGSYFSISTEVNADATTLALQEIDHEMNVLRNQKVPPEELKLVKQYLYGTFLRNFDGAFALAERFKSVRDVGLTFDFYLNSLDEILLTSAEQLLEMANTYLKAEDMIRLVVGNNGLAE